MIEKISSKLVYQNKWMKVYEDQVRFPSGHQGIYGVVDKPNFSLIIPVERNGFFLVRQFRYPVGKALWEFPQGSYQGADIPPLENAVKELKEETGYSAVNMEKIGFLYEAYCYCNQGFHIFLATNLVAGKQELEETEQGLELKWFSLSEFEKMIDMGDIADGPTVAAYGLYLRRLRTEK